MKVKAGRGLWALLLALLGLVVMGTFPAQGETPLLKRKLASEILVPFQPEVLSGRSWLVASGQDPALRLMESSKSAEERGGPYFQAPGAGAVALVPYRDPSAKFSRTILLSRDLGRVPFQTEPHLDVDPKDPNHIVAGVIDYNLPGIATYVSIDGGATWEGPSQPKFPRGELAGAGDPTVVFDRQGNVYAAQISLDVVEFRLGSVIGSALVSNVSVSPSEDGGFAWEEPVQASRGGVLVRTFPTGAGERQRGEVEVDFVDKPWMSIGPHWEKPEQDVIYVTYTKFVGLWNLIWSDEVPVLNLAQEEIVVELLRSEDGGQTWSRPVEVSPRVRYLSEEGGHRVLQGSQPLIARDGTLYVAWFDSTDDGPWEGTGEIWVATSRDGGRTFSRPRVAVAFLEPSFRPRSASFRLWGTVFPQLAAGPGQELYIAFTARPADNPEDDGDVFLVRSLDGGKSWERPLRVNDDGSGRLQFFPAIAVDPQGSLHAMWGDTRDDPQELAYHVYYSTSKDQGQTWDLNSRVSDFPSNPNFAFPGGRFIGDYFTIKASQEDVYMAWADSRLGQLGPVNQKIGFARKRLMPSPSIFLSPPSGAAGRDVVIQGHNYQPDSEVFVEMGGVVIATGRAQAEGGFSIQLFVPVAGEGASTVRVIDSSGNVASASFFTEFGFDSFQKAVTGLEAGVKDIAAAQAAQAARSPPPQQTQAESLPWLAVALAGAALLLAAAALTFSLRRRR